MMKENDVLQMMDEMEKNGVDMKEELQDAAKELPEMVKETVADGYKKIENSVVEGYKKIEESSICLFSVCNRVYNDSIQSKERIVTNVRTQRHQKGLPRRERRGPRPEGHRPEVPQIGVCVHSGSVGLRQNHAA